MKKSYKHGILFGVLVLTVWMVYKNFHLESDVLINAPLSESDAINSNVEPLSSNERSAPLKIEAGKISKEEAVQLAINRVEELGYHGNQPPKILMTTDKMIATFVPRISAFFNATDSFACKLSVDLLTQDVQVLSMNLDSEKRSYSLRLSPESALLSEEEVLVCQRRVAAIINELDDYSSNLGKLPELPNHNGYKTVPEDALKVADAVRKQGEYDKETPPHVSFVNGVYVVTYWKPKEVIDRAWKRYAYRICIDAESGEYIGMDYSTSVSDNPPE